MEYIELWMINLMCSILYLLYNIKLKNDLICLMISCMFCIFSLQFLDKFDLLVLEFSILDWYSNWHIKQARIYVCTYFHWNILILIIPFLFVSTHFLQYAPYLPMGKYLNLVPINYLWTFKTPNYTPPPPSTPKI